jgi:hypothetical protein
LKSRLDGRENNFFSMGIPGQLKDIDHPVKR